LLGLLEAIDTLATSRTLVAIVTVTQGTITVGVQSAITEVGARLVLVLGAFVLASVANESTSATTAHSRTVHNSAVTLATAFLTVGHRA
jgi:hypothetical protein